MLEKIVIVALIVIAIWSTMLYGMIFQFVRFWAMIEEEGKETVYRIPKWVCKPLFDCIICMSFWHGSIAYWLIWGNSGKEWAIVVIGAMGFNTIFTYIKIR